MQVRTIFGTFVLAIVVLTVAETNGRAQFGGFGFDPKNPESMFKAYADRQNAKDAIEIDKVQSRMDPELPSKMKAYAAKAGITNGKFTKEQFADFWTKEAIPAMEARMKQGGGFFGGRGPGGPGGPPSGPGTPMTPGSAPSVGGPTAPMGPSSFGGRGPGGPPGLTPPMGPAPMSPPGGEKTAATTGTPPATPAAPSVYQPRPFNEEESKSDFKSLDRDNSNSLSTEEAGSSSIRRDWEKWDTNKNMVIDLDEYLAYRKERHNQREEERRQWEEFRAARNAATNPTTPVTPAPVIPQITGPLEGEKPKILRYESLPKELPSWFKELDTDKDAQVGLYEWRAAAKDNNEFRNYDRNGDGLITPDEVLWFDKNKDRLAGIIPTGPSTPTVAKTGEKTTGPTGSSEKDKSGRPSGFFGGGWFNKGKDSSKDAKDSRKDSKR